MKYTEYSEKFTFAAWDFTTAAWAFIHSIEDNNRPRFYHSARRLLKARARMVGKRIPVSSTPERAEEKNVNYNRLNGTVTALANSVYTRVMFAARGGKLTAADIAAIRAETEAITGAAAVIRFMFTGILF